MRCGGLLGQCATPWVEQSALSTDQGHCVVFLGKTYYSYQCLSLQEQQITVGGRGGIPCNRLASHPGGRQNTLHPNCLMLQKPEISSTLMELGDVLIHVKKCM